MNSITPFFLKEKIWRLLYGLALMYVYSPRTAVVDLWMPKKLIHGLSCKYSAGRHPSHAALNDARKTLGNSVIPLVLELAGIDRRDDKKPDCISVFSFRLESVSAWMPHMWIIILTHTLIVQL